PADLRPTACENFHNCTCEHFARDVNVTLMNVLMGPLYIMKSTFAFMVIVALAGSFRAASASEISGKVKLKGTPKPEVPIQLDATCGKMHTTPVTTRHYVVGQDNGLANVFVYVKSGAQKTPPAGEPVTLDQVTCMYEPYVFGVVAGQ